MAASATGSHTSLERFSIAALVACASAAVFSGAIRWPYFADDWVYIEATQRPGWWHGPQVWAFGGILFRPVVYLYLGLAYVVFGLHALPVHLITFFLILIEAGLLYRLARRLGLGAGAMLAAVLVALDPAMVVPVAWASAVSSPIALDLTLGALVLLLDERPSRRRTIGAVVLYALAMLTREVVIGAAVVALLLRFAYSSGDGSSRRDRLISSARPALCLVAVDVLYGGIRLIGGFPPAGPDPYQQTIRIHAIRYLAHLAEWSSFVVVPHHAAAGAVWTVIFWTSLLAASVIAGRWGRPLALAGIAWAAIGLLPVVFLADQPLAYYYVDFAFPGVALAIGALTDSVWPAIQRWQPELPGWSLAVVSVFVLAGVSFPVSRAELSVELDHAPQVTSRLERAAVVSGPKDLGCLPRSDDFVTGDGAMYRFLFHDRLLHVVPC
jgi:hypothetical protein